MNRIDRLISNFEANLQKIKQDKQDVSVRYISYHTRKRNPIVWDGNYLDVSLIAKSQNQTIEQTLLELEYGELLHEAYTTRLIGNLVVIVNPVKNVVMSWHDVLTKDFKSFYKKVVR